MTFYAKTSTNNYIEYKLGQVCNLTITNDDAANAIQFSSNGTVDDIAILYAGETQTFLNISIESVFVQSLIQNSQANFRISAW